MKTQTNQEQKEDNKVGFDQEVLKLDFNQLKDGLSGFVRGTAEEALNGLLQAEAEDLCEARRHERTEARKAYRSGSYERIEEWRSRPLREDYPYLFVAGIWLKQS